MAQEQLGNGIPLERRSVRRVQISRFALCWLLGALEGALAGLVMLVPALTYHAVFYDIPLHDQTLVVYVGFALVTALIYGISSSMALSRLLHGTQRQHTELSDSAVGWTSAFALTLLLAFMIGIVGDLSRVSLLSAFLLGLPVLLGARGVAHASLGRRIQNGRLLYQKVGMIGRQGDVVRFLLNGDLWRSGCTLAGALYLEDARDDTGQPSRERVLEAARNWVAKGTDHIIIVGDGGDIDGLEGIANELKRFAVNVVAVPATANRTLQFLDVVRLGSNNGIRVLRRPMSEGAVLAKRLMDCVGALTGLVVLSPVFVIVAALIRLESPGPIIYRQARLGFNGHPFFIWKFRSMTVTESGMAMTQAQQGDKRVTRVGRFIRAASIDELPQLVNVLLGDMSLVGPRPHALIHDSELATQIANYAHRQRIKPGITGWAQVNGFRGQTTTFEQIDGRTQHDLHYIENWSVFLDVWIIILTLASKKTRENAH